MCIPNAHAAGADALATIAAMPGDRPVRVIATLAGAPNDPAAHDAAIAAAKAAGCSATPLRSGMISVEGPAQAVSAFARSSHVRSVQIDNLASPQ
jgi:hypothetical protein